LIINHNSPAQLSALNFFFTLDFLKHSLLVQAQVSFKNLGAEVKNYNILQIEKNKIFAEESVLTTK